MCIECPACCTKMKKINEYMGYEFYECQSCGFVTTRSIEGKDIRYMYDNEPAFEGENEYSNWDILRKEAERLLRKKYSVVGKAIEGNFLDIGCSEGLFVDAAVHMGLNAYGFEVDKPKIIRAKARGLNVTEPIYSSFEEGYFDFILSRHCMEHIPDFIDVFEEEIRLLKVGGVLCIETPNIRSLLRIFNGNKIVKKPWGAPGLVNVHPPTHIHGFTQKAWKLIGEKYGLDTVRTLTYAAAGDPNWCITSTYHGNIIKKLVFKSSACLGLGESVAAFFVKR